jgi:hypothetical protein
LAGWHRLASGLVRPRMDTHRLRSSSDRRARKCGGKYGVCASHRLRISHVHGCGDAFRVRAAFSRGNAGEFGVWSVCRIAYVCHCAGWLADSLATLNRRHIACSRQVSRVVALPIAVLRTRALSRHWFHGCSVSDLIRRTPISASQRRLVSPAWSLQQACPSRCQPKSGYQGTWPVPCRTGSAQDLRRQ